MNEQTINKKITYSIVAVLMIVLITIGATYAYFGAEESTDLQTVTTANLTMGFTNGDIVRATGITPIADSEIKTKATELPFTVTNTGNQHMDTKIKLTDITIADDLKDIDFRWGLYNADTDIGLSFGFFENIGTKKEITIYEDFIIDAGSEAKNYVLRIWIHDDGALQNEMQGETFSGKVTVTGEAVEYTPESCFTFDSSTGTITYKTLDFENGIFESGYSNECSREVIIPKTIGGVEVKMVALDNVKALGPVLKGEVQNFDELDRSEALTRVIIPDTVSTVSLMFNNLKHLTLPEGVEFVSATVNPFETISIPETLSSAGDYFIAGHNLTEITIPSSVRTVEALSGDNLKNVVLSEGNETIAYDALNNTKIKTIEIPSSVIQVHEKAFNGCSNLTEIVVRGKSSLDDFIDSTGLTTAGGLPEGVNIIFRP